MLENLPITANVLSHHQIILRGTPAYKKFKEQGRLKSSFSSAYEAVPVFVDHRVEALSRVVRRLTNFLFVRLGKFWTGRLDTPPDLAEKYQILNGLLVRMFEDLLVALESGERFSEEDGEALVREGEKNSGQFWRTTPWGVALQRRMKIGARFGKLFHGAAALRWVPTGAWEPVGGV